MSESKYGEPWTAISPIATVMKHKMYGIWIEKGQKAHLMECSDCHTPALWETHDEACDEWDSLNVPTKSTSRVVAVNLDVQIGNDFEP